LAADELISQAQSLANSREQTGVAGRASEKMSVSVVYLAPNAAIAPTGIAGKIRITFAHGAFVPVSSLTRGNRSPHRDRGIKKRALQIELIKYVTLSELN
jgi:hypothetical protein